VDLRTIGNLPDIPLSQVQVYLRNKTVHKENLTDAAGGCLQKADFSLDSHG
jgi:hypothetical protein